MPLFAEVGVKFTKFGGMSACVLLATSLSLGGDTTALPQSHTTEDGPGRQSVSDVVEFDCTARVYDPRARQPDWRKRGWDCLRPGQRPSKGLLAVHRSDRRYSGLGLRRLSEDWELRSVGSSRCLTDCRAALGLH